MVLFIMKFIGFNKLIAIRKLIMKTTMQGYSFGRVKIVKKMTLNKIILQLCIIREGRNNGENINCRE